LKKHPKGALLKLPFFTTDMKKKFFANLWLTFHSWSPFVMGVAAGVINHLTATGIYSFLVVKVDYICH